MDATLQLKIKDEAASFLLLVLGIVLRKRSWNSGAEVPAGSSTKGADVFFSHEQRSDTKRSKRTPMWIHTPHLEIII